MLHLLRKIVPQPIFQLYHYCLAKLAAFWYGYPSRELVVIGVTGTNGKTSTAYLIAKALEASGVKTGCTTTALFKVGDREWINTKKMTMPGRFFLQRMMRQMVEAGCRYAVIETSSQGLIQSRHIGVDYDVAVFTNLTPEHIEAHGGFENYRKAKRILFEQLGASQVKKIHGHIVPKFAVLNADDPQSEFFAKAPGLSQIEWYGIDSTRGMQAKHVDLQPDASKFMVDHVDVCLPLPGRYNVMNALAALAVAKGLGVDLVRASEALSMVHRIPGRFDRVDVGQPFQVIVDYAPEPESLKQLYQAVALIPHKRLIHVLGSCGGGRDVARRPILGRMAGETADVVVVTNEDPYDDDPKMIIDQVAAGAREVGKSESKDLFLVQDRSEAIRKAINLAEPQDIVLLTGKGCEAWICWERGRKQAWDEVEEAKKAIRERRG